MRVESSALPTWTTVIELFTNEEHKNITITLSAPAQLFDLLNEFVAQLVRLRLSLATDGHLLAQDDRTLTGNRALVTDCTGQLHQDMCVCVNVCLCVQKKQSLTSEIDGSSNLVWSVTTGRMAGDQPKPRGF